MRAMRLWLCGSGRLLFCCCFLVHVSRTMSTDNMISRSYCASSLSVTSMCTSYGLKADGTAALPMPISTT